MSENRVPEPSPTQEHLTPADVLNAAADLLEKPGAWTQGAASRDMFGNVGEEGDELLPDAVCWCLAGAVEHVGGNWSRPYTTAIRAALGLPMVGIGAQIAEWNDRPGRTQAEVVAKLREAAQLAQSNEASQ